MNKICTSIEQSKKLLELGVDINTADMCWTNHLFNAFHSSWRIESTPPQEYKNLLDRFVVRGYLIEPAWSLSALLDVFDNKAGLAKEYDLWFCYDNGKSYCTKHYINAIDACYEMIIYLHEQNLL